jgi:hypothetical protein
MPKRAKDLSTEDLVYPLKEESENLASCLRRLASGELPGVLIPESQHSCNSVSVVSNRILGRGSHSVFKRIDSENGRIFSLVLTR